MCDECRSFVIFTRRPSVSEGASDADDLFNLADVLVATVDCVTHSGNGGKDGLVGGSVVSDGDGCLGPSEWGVNRGTMMWNFWYGGWYVFLVRVVEFTGRLVWVWEVVV